MADNWWSNPGFKKFASEGLQDLGYGLANSTNLGNAFGAATTRMQQMEPYRAEQAQQQEAAAKLDEQTNATRSWLEQRGYTDLVPLVDAGQADIAYGEALKRMQPGYGDASAGVEYGLTPIWGQMPDGTFAYGVQGKDGSFQPVDTGEMTPLDPRSLAGERAFGTQVGGAQGAAVAAAPSDIATGQIALDLIQQIKTSPELPWATGTSAGLGGNAVPGTGRFGFQNLVDQAKSGAFLSAIQEMRGMGALSNAEGQTATQAITRMNTALSQADFVKALDDYERIVRTGVQRAQGRVGSGPSVGSAPAPSAGQNFVYNPATGQLEAQ